MLGLKPTIFSKGAPGVVGYLANFAWWVIVPFPQITNILVSYWISYNFIGVVQAYLQWQLSNVDVIPWI